MKNIIAIDVDDTVLDLMSTWLSLYNAEFNDNLKREQITDWNISQFVKSEAKDRMYEYIEYPDVFYGSLPIENSLQGINLLKSLGNRIVYITANNPENCKYHWLVENGFLDNKEDFICALDKSLIYCDYMIDDKYENIINSWGFGTLFNQSWNLQYEYSDRATDWDDIIKMIEEGKFS